VDRSPARQPLPVPLLWWLTASTDGRTEEMIVATIEATGGMTGGSAVSRPSQARTQLNRRS
jgi:hypothetical protein